MAGRLQLLCGWVRFSIVGCGEFYSRLPRNGPNAIATSPLTMADNGAQTLTLGAIAPKLVVRNAPSAPGCRDA